MVYSSCDTMLAANGSAEPGALDCFRLCESCTLPAFSAGGFTKRVRICGAAAETSANPAYAYVALRPLHTGRFRLQSVQTLLLMVSTFCRALQNAADACRSCPFFEIHGWPQRYFDSAAASYSTGRRRQTQAQKGRGQTGYCERQSDSRAFRAACAGHSDRGSALLSTDAGQAPLHAQRHKDLAQKS